MHIRFLILLIFVPYLAICSQSDADKQIKWASEDYQFINKLFSDKIDWIALSEIQKFKEKYQKSELQDDILFIEAQIHATNKSFNLAASSYEELLQNFPKSDFEEEALFRLGKLQVEQNNFIEGKKHLNNLLKEYPSTKFLPKIQFHLAEIDFFEKKWASAKTKYLRALKAADDNKELKDLINYQLAWVASNLKKEGEATRRFKNVETSSLSIEKKVRAALQLAEFKKLSKDFREAISIYKEISQKYTEQKIAKVAYFWMAEIIYSMGQQNKDLVSVLDQQKAILNYSEYISSENDEFESLALYHSGWMNYNFSKLKEAFEQFSLLQEKYQEYRSDYNLNLIRAEYFESKESWSEANNVLISALDNIEKEETKIDFLVKISRNYVKTEDCKQILTWTKKLRGKKTLFRDEINIYRGDCFYIKNNYTNAKIAFSKVSPSSKYFPEVKDKLFQILSKLNQWKEVYKLSEKVLKQSKYHQDKTIYAYQMQALSQLSYWKTLRGSVLQYLKKFNEEWKNPKILLYLAEAYQKTKNPKSAAKYYEKAFELIPDSESEQKLRIVDQLASVYEGLRQFDKILRIYESSIPLIQDKTKKESTFLYLGSAWYSQFKNLSKAEEWLKRLHLKGNTDNHFQASFLLAEFYLNSKKTTAALETLKDALKKNQLNKKWHPLLNQKLAEIYHLKESWKLATIYYQRSLKYMTNKEDIKTTNQRISEIKNYLKSLKKNKAS